VPPLVALVTDFGSRDSYVAEMKARANARVPDVRWLDVSHEIPAFDRMRAAIVIERAIAELPRGSALVAVVDPGVGTTRRRIVVSRHGIALVGPDNGILPTRDAEGVFVVDEAKWPRRTAATTFDGREIFAPLGALLAAGLAPALVGPAAGPCEPWVIPDDAIFVSEPDRQYARGTVIASDHYGNAVTDIRPPAREGVLEVLSPGAFAGPVRRAYGEVERGAPLALVGSSGRLELAVREGSASLANGTPVEVAWRSCR
jgi:S-adenosylmethionine hydrolase